MKFVKARSSGNSTLLPPKGLPMKKHINGLLFLITLVLVAWSTTNLTPRSPAWDDGYFLEKSACVSVNAWQGHFHSSFQCLSTMSKSPIMAFLLLPWGWKPMNIETLSFAATSLMGFIFCLIAISFYALYKSDISPLKLMLAALALALNPILHDSSGIILSDNLVSWAVIALFSLVFLESTLSSVNLKCSILMGLLWAIPINIGLLSKVTFCFFLIFLVPSLLFVRWRRSSQKSLFISMLTAGVVSIPTLIIWLKFGSHFIDHAIMFSHGPLAAFYSVPGMDKIGFLNLFLSSVGKWRYPVLLLATIAIGMSWSRKKWSWYEWVPTVAILAYYWVCSGTPNRDLRFVYPVMYGLPLALCLIGGRQKVLAPIIPIYQAISFTGMIGLLILAPRSLGTENLNQIADLYESIDRISVTSSLPGDIKMIIAHENAHFNINTFQLVTWAKPAKRGSIVVDTTVYDFMHSVSLEESKIHLAKNDLAIFVTPLSEQIDFTSKYSKDLFAFAKEHGTPLALSSTQFTVFQLDHSK